MLKKISLFYKVQKKFILVIYFLIITYYISYSQPSSRYQHLHYLLGAVKDAQGNYLANGSVYITPTSLGLGTNTDNNGEFKLPYIQLPITIVLKFPGYEPDTLSHINKNTYLTIVLKKTQSYKMQDVIVETGTGRAASIRTNPITIIKVSKEAIQMTTQSNIIDVLSQNVPGLTAVKTGPNISKPYIRGLGYNRVLTLFDGIRQEGQQWGDEHGLELDDYLIGGAEILEGPASLIYGSDAIAGVVSLSPTRPNQKDGSIHGTSYSEFQGNNGLIGNSIQVSYGNSHLSFLVAGTYRIAKNYISPIDGRVYNTGFQEADGSAFLYYYTKKWKSELGLTIYDNLQGIPDGSRDSLTRQFTKQIYESNLDNPKNRPIVSPFELNSYKLSPLHQRIQHYRAYIKNNYILQHGEIETILGFQQNIRREYDHPTNLPQAGLYVRLNTFNYSFKYNVPTFYNIDISTGVNGMYQNNKNLNATIFPIPNYQLFDAGAYIYAQWKHKAWVISGGFRYDIRWIQGDNFYTATNPANGFPQQWTEGDTVGRNVNLAFPSFNKIYNNASASLGATYELNHHISFKVNIGRGYRSPNIAEFASNGLDPGANIYYIGNRGLNPEYNLQEDIGVLLDYGFISASVSLFNNNLENFIYLTRVLDANGNPLQIVPGTFTYQYKQTIAQIYGLDALITAYIPQWKGFKWTNNFAITYGFNRNPAYKGKGIMGEYLPLIPPLRLISTVQQTVTLHSKYIPSCFANVGMEFDNQQNRYLALTNTETYTPSYTLFNISLGMTVKYNQKKNSNLLIQFQTNNLFNVAYQSNLSRLKYFEFYTQSPTDKFRYL